MRTRQSHNLAHDEFIKLNTREYNIMQCKKCSTLVDVFWIKEDYDHEGMCGPCLNREKLL